MKDLKARVSVTGTDVVMNFRGKEAKAPYANNDQRATRVEDAMKSITSYSKKNPDSRVLVAMERGNGRVSAMHIVNGERVKGLPDGFSVKDGEIVGGEPQEAPQEAPEAPSEAPAQDSPAPRSQPRKKPSLADRSASTEAAPLPPRQESSSEESIPPMPEHSPDTDRRRRDEEVVNEETVSMPVVEEHDQDIDEDDGAIDEPLAPVKPVKGDGIGSKIVGIKDSLKDSIMSQFAGSDEDSEEDVKKRKLTLMLIAGGVVLTLVLVLGIIFIPKMFGGDEPVAEPSPSATQQEMETVITPSPVLDGWSRNANWHASTGSGLSTITGEGYLAYESDNALHVKLSDGEWSSDSVQGKVKSLRSGTIKDKDGTLVDGVVLLTSTQVLFVAIPSDKVGAVQVKTGEAQEDSFLTTKGGQPLLSYNNGAGAAVLSIAEGVKVKPIPMNSAPISADETSIYSAQGNGTVSITPIDSSAESKTITMTGPDPKKSVPVKWGNVTSKYTIIVWDSVDTYQEEKNHAVTVAVHNTQTGEITDKFKSTSSIYSSPRLITNEKRNIIGYGDMLLTVEDGAVSNAVQIKSQRAFSYAGNDHIMFVNGEGQLSQIDATGKTAKKYTEQIATPFGIVSDGRLAVVQDDTVFLVDKIEEGESTESPSPTEGAASDGGGDADAPPVDPGMVA